jgi:uncharacterized protein YjbI with pentapeptide repeats
MKKGIAPPWSEQRLAGAEAMLAEGEVVDQDLRGALLPGPRLIRGTKLLRVRLERARLEEWSVETCSFDAVNFSAAKLSGWRDQGNVFANCLFEGTSLKDGGLGYQGSRFRSCRFVRVDFRRVSFARPEFDDCAFESCRFEGVDLFASSFERCAFTGTVAEAWFRGGYPLAEDEVKYGPARHNRMLDVDFSMADLRWVTFSGGCDLSTCRLPADEQVVRFGDWPRVLARARKVVAERLDGTERDEAQRWLGIFNTHAQRQDWYIVNFRDIAEETRNVLGASFRDLLLECAATTVH